ncbi:H-NS histone family protein [Acinetobacter baumannii]|uniref:H-NS histone family protein n=1 Tax=Acinetobacter baumannii TaxID=470 RepID=UPI0023421F65|nr:H-NS histone family protein [Acinetobacter baumannii]MDC4147556.1 H-NS histone family protein [Acinetobacter baumannii]
MNIENLSDLTVEQLQKLQLEAGELIEVKKEQALQDAYDQIIQIAENTGKTVEELMQFGKEKNKQNRKPVLPRYRNKSNAEETWTGRGKQPRWLVQEIENGAKLEDFLI